MEKFKEGRYWLELKFYVIDGRRRWHWILVSCNGRIKSVSKTLYHKRSLAYNDAKAFSDYTGLKIRE